MKKRNSMRYFLILLLLIPFSLKAQDTLRFDRFMQRVLGQHPAAQATRLLQEQGRLEIRAARGAFDPQLGGYYDQKQFQDKEYWQRYGGELKLPTRLGIGLKAGYDFAEGTYLNPEFNMPANGLWYAGINVPLGQGLFFDEGRAGLRAAQIRQQGYSVQQQQELAELASAAANTYWQWAGAWEQVSLLENALEAAQNRYVLVFGGYEVGELPAIDTLEAGIQLQNLQSQLVGQLQNLQKAEMALAAFSWRSSSEPAPWQQARPQPMPPTQLSDSLLVLLPNWPAPDSSQLLQLTSTAPSLRMYQYKLEELETDRRWKAEKLKPKLDASYNLLSAQDLSEVPAAYRWDNYKLGASLKFPLLLRQERGNLQLARLKIQRTELQQRQKRIEVRNKLAAQLQSLDLLNEQIALARKTAAGYRRLWEAEIIQFELGESTLFYVNARELKYVESQQKLIELQVKYLSQEAELKALLGISL